jgi:hypothetical protein
MPLNRPLVEARLFKTGRATLRTTGCYGGLMECRIAREVVNGEEREKVTMEHTVIGRQGEPFSRPGDSGALVYTRAAEVVGLHFGGREKEPISYFTHVVDLFEDIKHVTNAIEVRIL